MPLFSQIILSVYSHESFMEDFGYVNMYRQARHYERRTALYSGGLEFEIAESDMRFKTPSWLRDAYRKKGDVRLGGKGPKPTRSKFEGGPTTKICLGGSSGASAPQDVRDVVSSIASLRGILGSSPAKPLSIDGDYKPYKGPRNPDEG